MISKLKRKKIFIRSLKVLLILVSLIIVAFSVLIISIYSNHNSIKKVIINELNKSLQTEISVKDITFSVFNNFPNAALVFKEIIAKDATNNIIKGNLLEAESFSIEFNLLDIYFKKYNIRDIRINNAKINLKVDQYGNNNFIFWKSQNIKTPDQLKFNLKNILLKNVDINYINRATHQYYEGNLLNVKARFFTADNINSLALKGDIYLKTFQSEKVVYLKSEKISISAKALIDENTNFIKIQKGLLNFGKKSFDVKGNINYSASNKAINLTVKGNNIEIVQLIDNLPESIRTSFSHYKSKGIIDLIIQINGLYGGLNLPSVTATFKLINGEIFYPKSKVKMTNINLEGSFNNGKGKGINKNQLFINKINGKIENSFLYGNLSIIDFSNPSLNSNINGKINLEDISKFFGKSIFKELKGFVDINLSYNGLLKQNKIDVKSIINSGASGSITLQNVFMQFIDDDRKFEEINSSLVFNDNSLQINKLSGKVNNSDFEIKGSFANVIPFLLLENQTLTVNAEQNSKNFVLEDIIFKISKDKNTSFKINNLYNINLNLYFEKFSYQNFIAKQLIGKLTLSKNVLKFEKAQMKALGGAINGNLSIDRQSQNKFLITSEANTQAVNANQLFAVFKNFGQHNLTNENIDGSLTSNIQFAAFISPSFKLDRSSVWSKIQIKIDNGKLANYKTLQKLSKYINEDELKDVSFKTIENQILINDEIIYIPSMEIKSSAINLTLSGKHQFNNQIEYRVNILLSELLSKKRKLRKQNRAKQQEEFGYEEDDGLGRTRIFLKISGTIDNPVFSYDTKSLKDKIFNDLKIEKSNLKNILKEEFNWAKKDTSEILFEHRIKQQEKGKFVIDWEDTNTGVNSPNNKKDALIPSGVKVKWDEE